MAHRSLTDAADDVTSNIKTGLELGSTIADNVAELGSTDAFKKIGKMAKFLGAAGGFISVALVFLPSQDSAELAYMKKQFTMVNTKLDKVTSKLDDIKSLITYQSQRSAYISSSRAILDGHQRLFKFINEVQKTLCPSKSACERIRARIAERYVKSLNVRKHLENILKGTFSRTSVFGDPLLVLVSKTSKCNFAQINMFVSGVIKLAFKGQQVVLAYEKLMGSKHSITQSMNDWLKNIYRLRTESYIVKNKCFKGMKYQLIKDIRNSDYQTKSPSNAAANKAVKSFLEKKYPWLNVVVFSYNAYGSKKHCDTDAYGGLWNMPKNKNARKRNIIVGVVDKKGTYANQRSNVLRALDGIFRHVNFYREFKSYCKVLGRLKTELQRRNVWKYVSSLSIRSKAYGLNVLSDDEKTTIDKAYHFWWRKRIGLHTFRGFSPVHVVAVLKSKEQANGGRCKLACKNHGKCKRYPYSSSQYCQCKPFYQGNLCEKHSRAPFAKTIDSMLAVTLKLPVLSDVYFDIKDLRQFVGVNFANMQRSISKLESSMQRKFNQLSNEIKDQFKWSKFITIYRTAIQTIEYYSHRFERLPKEHTNEEALERYGRKLATSVLKDHHGIRKALYQLNNMLAGKVNKPLLQHKPILLAYMESKFKAGEPCTLSYKRRVDNYWRRLLLLQQMGYMVWAQALEFMNRKSSYVSNVYKSRIGKQLNAIKKGTCQYDIRYSVNVHCNKHYLPIEMTIKNKCNSGYYVHGPLLTSCKKRRSSCLACNCYRYGSTSLQCSNSGKCSCKTGFKGKRCSNRDCVWSNWSLYRSCSCGYGQRTLHKRAIRVPRVGNGRPCKGPVKKYERCFTGCCSNQFHCSSKSKCITASYKCDYDDDCGDNQDERSCNERCHTRYTRWGAHGGGRLIFLDKHHPSCHSGESMTMFHLQRAATNIRYQYKCCRVFKSICSNKRRKSGYIHAVHNTWTYELRHQSVSCGSTGYISSFRLHRSSNHRSIRYEYNCCYLKRQRHRRRTSCYRGHTGWTADGKGKNFYLDRQTVSCRPRYFLNAFKLLYKKGAWWKMGKFRYYYRCCRIKS